jgi:hypothetical protein
MEFFDEGNLVAYSVTSREDDITDASGPSRVMGKECGDTPKLEGAGPERS